jgi:alpha-tubulin suppressor-like RCC1 family protein
MGRLLVGQTCDVRLIWRKAPEDQTPTRVTADLAEIGGPAEQELAESENGTWRWTGQVTPDVQGERLITITAVDAQVQKKEMSKRFPVFNTDKAIAIGAGSYQLLAVKADGTVVAWGCDEDWSNEGQCNVPAAITNAVAVAGGDFHSIALNADGTVVAWGMYYYDFPIPQNPFFPGEYREMFVPEGLADVVAIAAYSRRNLALKADGTVVAWGCAEPPYWDSGQCVVPADLTDVIAIAAGGRSSFALKADGTVVSWGWEIEIQTHNAVAVSGGENEALVLNEYGEASVYCATSDCPSISVRVGRGFKALAGRNRDGLGLRKDGTVVSWTYHADNIRYYSVNEVPGNFLAIAKGTSGYSMALAADGSLKEWYYYEHYGHIRYQPVPDELQ